MINKPLTGEEFNAIYSKVPRLNVEVVVKTDSGIVLTLRSIEPCKGQWHIPGGTVYFGETLEDAVKRVAMDELGIEVNINRLLGYIAYPRMHAEGYFGWPIGVAFEVSVIKGELRGSEQGEEFRIFKKAPHPMIVEQTDFLRENQLLS